MYGKQSHSIHTEFWHADAGVGPMVIVADPDVLEEVLRAEGKYPQSPKMKWFSDQHGIPATFSK